MNVRIKRGLNDVPMNTLVGQPPGPAVIKNPKLRNQKDSALVIATGVRVPP
jgi:hypothetical protein